MSIGSSALAQKAGITYRQLDTWTQKGLIRPEPLDYSEPPTNGGQGKARSYDRVEADTVMVIAELTRIGLRPVDAEPIARQFLRGEKAVRLGGFELRRVGP